MPCTVSSSILDRKPVETVSYQLVIVFSKYMGSFGNQLPGFLFGIETEHTHNDKFMFTDEEERANLLWAYNPEDDDRHNPSGLIEVVEVSESFITTFHDYDTLDTQGDTILFHLNAPILQAEKLEQIKQRVLAFFSVYNEEYAALPHMMKHTEGARLLHVGVRKVIETVQMQDVTPV